MPYLRKVRIDVISQQHCTCLTHAALSQPLTRILLSLMVITVQVPGYTSLHWAKQMTLEKSKQGLSQCAIFYIINLLKIFH